MGGGPQEPPVEVELGEAGRNWERPPVAPFDPATTSLGERRTPALAYARRCGQVATCFARCAWVGRDGEGGGNAH